MRYSSHTLSQSGIKSTWMRFLSIDDGEKRYKIISIEFAYAEHHETITYDYFFRSQSVSIVLRLLFFYRAKIHREDRNDKTKIEYHPPTSDSSMILFESIELQLFDSNIVHSRIDVARAENKPRTSKKGIMLETPNYRRMENTHFFANAFQLNRYLLSVNISITSPVPRTHTKMCAIEL